MAIDFDSILEEATNDVNYLHDSIQFEIDPNLRTTAIPPNGVVIAVQGDHNVNRVNFKMPVWYNGFNMSQFNIRVNFIDPEGNVNYYYVEDKAIFTPDDIPVSMGVTPAENDVLYFTWMVSKYATRYIGDIVFNVRFTSYDGDTLVQAFNTTKGYGTILEGIQLAGEITQEEQEDLLFHLTEDLHDVTDVLKIDIEAKGAEVYNSIPSDYSSLSNSVAVNASNIATNAANIESITENVAVNTADILSLQAATTSLQTQIDDIDNTAIEENATAIEELRSDLETLEQTGFPEASIETAVENYMENNPKASDSFVKYEDHVSTYNQNKVAINGYQHISKNAYGARENATGLSVMVNSSGPPEVLNVDTQGLASYHDRDIVGAYVSADGRQPIYTIPISKITYSDDGCVVDYEMPDLLPDMVIDTIDNNYVGVVKTYDPETGEIVLEDGWWHKQNHVKGKPVGTGFYVQKTTKVWGINVNVGLPAGIQTNAATIEAGLYNNGSTGSDRGVLDAVLLKGAGDYGVRSRGDFFYGFLAHGSTRGFAYRPTNEYNPGLVCELPNGQYFVINANGGMNRTIKLVSEMGSGYIENGKNLILEAADGATATLPENSPRGTIIEFIIASANSITFEASDGDTIWYEGGTDTSATFANINHSLFRIIKALSNQWLIYITPMARLMEANFTDTDRHKTISAYTACGTRMVNLCPTNTATIDTQGFVLEQDINLLAGEYWVSWEGTATEGAIEFRALKGNTVLSSFTIDNSTDPVSKKFSISQDANQVTIFTSAPNTLSKIMIRDTTTDDDYVPYTPTLQAQISALEARIAALEA